MRRHQNYTETQVILPPPPPETAKEPLPKAHEEVVKETVAVADEVKESSDEPETVSAKEEIVIHKQRRK